ncbi:hypothetical protein [Alkalibacillus aidingensis]|uniref:hypothetical protein n=1 Tax=Alkalibacillus aidingensis TaxID=2747607 RepID=UPI001660E558|nr:hypothetical protein [Alkalibacillus aidingensis]
MKNRYQKPKEEFNFNSLNENMVWNMERQRSLKQRLLNSMDQLEKPSRRLQSSSRLVFPATVVAFMFFIVIGYIILPFGHDGEVQAPIDVEEEEDQEDDNTDDYTDDESEGVELDTDRDTENQPVRYHGRDRKQDSYLTLGLADEMAMYLIEANVPDLTIEEAATINFSPDDKVREMLESEYGLITARGDIPLERYQVVDEHLQLYFNEEDLTNVRGSTGVSMGLFSISAFASNFKGEVDAFTGFGDEQIFYHHGEEFDLDDRDLGGKRYYFPIKTEKGVFLASNYSYIEGINSLFDDFFGAPEQSDLIDLSMLSVESLEENGSELDISIEGDLEKAAKDNSMEEENIKELVSHGLGLNIKHHEEFFENPLQQMNIRFNDEDYDQLTLDDIVPNVIEKVWE